MRSSSTTLVAKCNQRIKIGLRFAAFLLVFSATTVAQNTAVCWGLDSVGQVSGAPTDDVAFVAAGNDVSIAIKPDGSLIAWGDTHFLTPLPAGNDFQSVSVDFLHAVALRTNGSLVSWGFETHGQIANTPLAGTYTQVATGISHSMALGQNGAIVSWGRDLSGEVSNTPFTSGHTYIAASYSHSHAIRSDGTIASWGLDSYGTVSATPAGSGFAKLAAGHTHVVALKTDGTLVSWGGDSHGQVSNTPSGNDFVEVAAGFDHSVALRSDGRLVAWGNDADGQVTDAPASGVYTSIDCGLDHAVAVGSDVVGTAFCFGDVSDAVSCPCGNDVVLGTAEGCKNSTGSGADLWASGTTNVAVDDFVLRVRQARPNQPALFLQGAAQISFPFKDGKLCMGNPTERLEFVILDSVGEGNSTTSIVTEGAVSSGFTRYYQAWYRDPAISPCGTGSNFSSGLIIDWN